MYGTVQYIFVHTVGAYSLSMSGVLVYFYIVFYRNRVYCICESVSYYCTYYGNATTGTYYVLLKTIFGQEKYGNVCTYIVLLPVTNSTEYRVRMASVCLLLNRRGRE